MSDVERAEDVPVVARGLGAAVVTMVAVPLLLLMGYLLLWFFPEVAGTERLRDAGALRWIALAVSLAAVVVSLGGMWARLAVARRWWPWPIAVLASLGASWAATTALV